MKKKNIIMVILIILWCFIIFNASSKTSTESNIKSKELIYKTSKEIIKITNTLHITKINLNDETFFQKMVNTLNYPFRKCAHASVYFILSILFILLLKNLSFPSKKTLLVTIAICFLYSITDEFHQTFVNGRTGQFSDCLIDTLGAMLGSGITLAVEKKKKTKAAISVKK